MPKTKLTPDQRRALILALLSGTPAIELARRYGVARSRVYALAEEAKANPVEAMLEAWEEYAFRDQVVTLTKGEK